MRNRYAKMGIHRQPATTNPEMSSGTPFAPSPIASNQSYMVPVWIDTVAVRTAPNSKKKPPTSIIPGDDAFE